MRLIDADALKKKAEMHGHSVRPLVTAYHMCVSVHAIDDAPTIEAEPVKHGRWGDNGIPESMLSKCSVCDYSCGAYSFNYCPNCGAKMDLL